MSGFVLQLRDVQQCERIEGVTSFVGEDGSGSFGILPGHARMITTLGFGLARFRLGDSPWQYVAVPGAVLYFARDELFLSTRHYLRGSDYGWISTALQEKLAAEEETLRAVKESLRRLEEELLRRMWQIGREAARR